MIFFVITLIPLILFSLIILFSLETNDVKLREELDKKIEPNDVKGQ